MWECVGLLDQPVFVVSYLILLMVLDGSTDTVMSVGSTDTNDDVGWGVG